MRRTFLHILTFVISLSLLAFTASAQGVPESTLAAKDIESIVLTISPSCGLEEEMIDTVRMFYPNAALISLLH